MEKKTKFKTIARKMLYVLECAVWVILLLIAVGVLIKTYRSETSSLSRIQFHKYLGIGFIGIVVFFVSFIIPRIRQNVRWMMTFTHEFTHLLFALLFCRKIHRFNVDNKDSHVSFSGGWFGYHAITLSPYCVPIFTLALLPWRLTTGSTTPGFLAAIDILIGFTYAFHICCWVSQTRLYQTDITGPGVVKSLLCIATFHILNFCLIVLTPSSGVVLAIQRVFWSFPKEWVLTLLG